MSKGDTKRPRPIGKAGHAVARANLRELVSQTAARLIAEGLTDYQAAKVKAAMQLGVSDSQALPNDAQLEEALRSYQSLYQYQTQREELATLREIALKLMRQLNAFSPWLVGAVLNGTANQYSEIELEIVGTEPKAFEHYLLNANVAYQADSASHAVRRKHTSDIKSAYRMEYAGASVSITLYEHHAARQQSVGSRRADRAQLEEAMRRFAAADCA